jgi:tripartite-type tricarboxylate transporter receptor subunit TctC
VRESAKYSVFTAVALRLRDFDTATPVGLLAFCSHRKECMRRIVCRAALALSAAVLCSFSASALAQAWPSRQPIKLIVAFPPGGSVDQVARLLAVPLSQQLGQSVVVENRSGASGSIGTAAVAAAPGDGYQFAVVFDTHGVNPALIPNLPYDTRKDLVTVSVLGTAAMVLSTHTGSEYKSLADVIAAVKAKKSVGYGTVGAGSLGHLAMALLGKNAGIDWVHVPYKGGGPMMADAVAGHVPLAIGTVFVTKPHVDSGRLRPLVVTTSKRTPIMPDVPTVAESGFAGFDAPAWWAILASAKTPPDILERMNAEIAKALKSPEIAAKLSQQGIDIDGGSLASARSFVERQLTTWADVVKQNNITAN